MDLATLRTLLRQRLASDRRFGVTHLPRPEGGFDLSFLEGLELPESPPPAAAPGATGSASGAGQSVRQASTPVPAPAKQSRPTRVARGWPSPESIPTGENLTPPNWEESTLSRAERTEKLEALAQRVSVCERCPELVRSRTQTVFGTGNPEAALMFIGEAPGADEDRQGEPFVGRSGQLLNKIIAACRLTREEIYIANILKCRPPSNRDPSPTEAANCREYLTQQIALVDPDYIVCWGKPAVNHLLGTSVPLGKLRQHFFAYGRAKVAATYHPSYLLRSPGQKKKVWEDMIWLFQDMGVDLTKSSD